ncbi:MAG: hypothetical protein H0T42_26945 [Deltaproteobacteria bacterium]|nr:hypothetical protein [Deltaproteobacteria bacterium]
MTAPNRRRLIAQRIALVALVGLVAVLFLSSSFIAGVIALVTIVAVVVDSIAFAQLTATDTGPDTSPHTITVDLSRRS